MAAPALAPAKPLPQPTVNIQIRGVPEDIHKRLKARAALEGTSLSDMLLREITLIAGRKSNTEILRALESQEPVRLPENLVADMVRAMRGDF
jgi:plasmid stability protein